jgi:hypothetical protein
VLRVWPNPAQDELYVEGLGNEDGYKLCNLLRVCVLKGSLQAGKNVLSLKGLPHGVYCLEVWDANGGSMRFYKVVKNASD